jgi:hypothetical protein
MLRRRRQSTIDKPCHSTPEIIAILRKCIFQLGWRKGGSEHRAKHIKRRHSIHQELCPLGIIERPIELRVIVIARLVITLGKWIIG